MSNTQHTGTINADDAEAQQEAIKALMATHKVPFEQAVNLYIDQKVEGLVTTIKTNLGNVTVE